MNSIPIPHSLHIPSRKSSRKGFTLIELLVVISIIALLSSIILAVLDNSRSRGQYASAQESLVQMRNFYELQYSTANGYSAYMPTTLPSDGHCVIGATNNYCQVTSTADCDTEYTAGTQPDGICKNIINQAGLFVFGIINTSVVLDVNNYAFAVPNPSVPGSWFCVRNSGNNLTNTTGFAACITKNAGTAW